MDDRTRYEIVKSRLRAMGDGTARQVHDALDPTPYSLHEVQSTLDEMVLAERDEFEKKRAAYIGGESRIDSPRKETSLQIEIEFSQKQI